MHAWHACMLDGRHILLLCITFSIVYATRNYILFLKKLNFPRNTLKKFSVEEEPDFRCQIFYYSPRKSHLNSKRCVVM